MAALAGGIASIAGFGIGSLLTPLVASEYGMKTQLALWRFRSRLKDYYDLALLSRMYSFQGEKLINAVVAIFQHQGMRIEAEPIGLTDAFHDDATRMIQWRAFICRSRFTEQSGDLERLVSEVRAFALPFLSARPVRSRSTASGKRVDPGDDSTIRRITFGRTILEFPVLWREFDLESRPVCVFGGAPQRRPL